MRISDWSSDVCSSDLIEHRAEAAPDRARHLEFEALVAPAAAIAAPVDLIGAIEQVRIGAARRDAARGLRPRNEDARPNPGRGRVDAIRLDENGRASWRKRVGQYV